MLQQSLLIVCEKNQYALTSEVLLDGTELFKGLANVVFVF